MVQCGYLDIVMETKDYFKNETNSKSQMNRGSFLRKVYFTLLAVGLISIGCKSIVSEKTFAQRELTITDINSGLRLSVINKEFPILKLLLPNQLNSERGIEIEFP